MVDLDGKQLAGGRPRTSEILMHLEIYKEVPEAKAVVHCHPAHATAYAITGRVPPTCVIPEYEVFIGKVALSPYETPGTPEFARTVIPFVKNHNTVLLANHGIVCWGDTVTHAEWYAEVVDTYCWTLMLAAQLGTPRLPHRAATRPPTSWPSRRSSACPTRATSSRNASSAISPTSPARSPSQPRTCGDSSSLTAAEIESIVQAVTDRVVAALNKK